MSRTEEEITRETEGTEEPCGVIVDEMDNILHMANEINQILVFHTGRFTNNLFSNLPNDVGLVVNGSDFSSVRATGLEGFQNQEIGDNRFS